MSPARSNRSLKPAERRLLVVLGLPTLAMAFSTTAVSTYLPVVARQFTGSAAVIGVVIAGEGLMALFVPLLAGSWSDHFRARGGSRLAFVVAGVPVVVAALAPLGLVRSLVLMGLLVAIFFAGNFFSYEPYRALYPDTLDNEVAGRAQGTQAVWRGAGTVLALAGGGLLLSAWRGLPFILAAGLQASAVAALTLLLPRVSRQSRRRKKRPGVEDFRAGAGDVARRVRALLRERPDLRVYMLANCLWELSLGALKTFVVLYVTEGLHHSLSAASLIVGAVAVIVLLGGLAIQLLRGPMSSTHGFAAVWIVTSASILLSIPVLERLAGRRHRAEPAAASG
jgi:MFS family permease